MNPADLSQEDHDFRDAAARQAITGILSNEALIRAIAITANAAVGSSDAERVAQHAARLAYIYADCLLIARDAHK